MTDMFRIVQASWVPAKNTGNYDNEKKKTIHSRFWNTEKKNTLLT